MAAVGPAPGDAPRRSRAGQQVSAGSGGGVGGPLTPSAASSLREGGLSGRLSLGSRSAGRRRRPRLHPLSPRCVPACGPAVPAPCRLRLPPDVAGSPQLLHRNPGRKQSPAWAGRVWVASRGAEGWRQRRRGETEARVGLRSPWDVPDSAGERRMAPRGAGASGAPSPARAALLAEELPRAVRPGECGVQVLCCAPGVSRSVSGSCGSLFSGTG